MMRLQRTPLPLQKHTSTPCRRAWPTTMDSVMPIITWIERGGEGGGEEEGGVVAVCVLLFLCVCEGLLCECAVCVHLKCGIVCMYSRSSVCLCV